MKTNAPQLVDHAHYFVPNPSIYPVILSFGMFLLALGFVELINGFHLGKWVMLGGPALFSTYCSTGLVR
jgi:cytochrome c oxidase subunit 3